ncbi:hypothetical protein GCM10020367_16450 [Streptomyces sannanensis]|uniref:Small hydrophilic protein n=1 Tax=Streptomyces sannanensis TaxID=285536 RepID=A0ABP6S8A9_9ACTN
MAKNRNQPRTKQQPRSTAATRSTAAERGAEQAKSSSMEAQAEQRQSQVTPNVAHKGRQKRFGHN